MELRSGICDHRKTSTSPTLCLKYAVPDVAHVPGRNARPGLNNAACIAARAAPEVTDVDNWMESDCYLYGFDLYHAGYFWEAHEVWEPVWMGCPPNSPARHLVQGLIQTSNACLKALMKRPGAVGRLNAIAIDCLKRAGLGGKAVMGLDIDDVVEQLKLFDAKVATACEPAIADCLAHRPIFSLTPQIM